MGRGGQGGCEQRIEAIVKMEKKVGGSRGGGMGLAVWIEVIVRMKKSLVGPVRGGARAYVNEKLKLL